MPGTIDGKEYPIPGEGRNIPGAPPGVVAMKLHTRESRRWVCEACGEPIEHPSECWGCGACWFKRRKGVRHPDGMKYWHDKCL